MVLAREIASLIGLPETTAFTDYHPAKLFDFSSRARCATPFRVVGLAAGGAQHGAVVAADLEAHAYLCAEESKYFERAEALAREGVAKCDAEVTELESAIAQTASGLASMRASLEDAADGMLAKAASLVAVESPPLTARRRQSTGVRDDEWEDDDALPNGPEGGGGSCAATAAAAAQQRRQEYGAAASTDGVAAAAEDVAIEEARLEAYKRSLLELQTKRGVQQKQTEASEVRRAQWAARVAALPPGAMAQAVPVLPVGDAILEPFWPQGLGSNRGFHSALDAVWTVHVAQTEGLEAALLERSFWYDLMLLGPWQAGAGLLKGADGWRADPVSRYADGAILRTKSNYTNPQSRRLFRGEGATPKRIAALDIQAKRGADGTNIFR